MLTDQSTVINWWKTVITISMHTNLIIEAKQGGIYTLYV